MRKNIGGPKKVGPDFYQSVLERPIAVVNKHSWLSHAEEVLGPDVYTRLKSQNDPLIDQLEASNQNNQNCLSKVKAVLAEAGYAFKLISRAALKAGDLDGHLVICVGGDGTVLAANQFANDSVLVGVNSDPGTSVGALCGADEKTFQGFIEDMKSHQAEFLPLYRLQIYVNGDVVGRAINDVLLANSSPGAMSRYQISLGTKKEDHRGSGLWICTSVGSSGAVFSSGGSVMDLRERKAQFRAREPFWCNVNEPAMLAGTLAGSERLVVDITMLDAQIFIDGPHQVIDLPWGSRLTVEIMEEPLWLYYPQSLEWYRESTLKARKGFRGVLR
jgi:NAD kinase